MMSFVSKKWNKVVSSKYVSLGHVFVDDCSHAIYSDPPRHKLGCYEKQQTRKFLLLTRERKQYMKTSEMKHAWSGENPVFITWWSHPLS